MNNVLSIRKRLGLSQKALGEGISVSQGNVSFYELNKQEVPPDVARRLIEFAGTKGLAITFNDVYAAPDEATNHKEAA